MPRLRRVGELRAAGVPARRGVRDLHALPACGQASACYTKPARGVFEAPVEGRSWAPPCVAVQRLRDCLHRPYSLLQVDGWCVSNYGESAGA